jgi:hypothetical protein
MSLENTQQIDSASIQNLSVGILKVGAVTSSLSSGAIIAGVISSGEPTASYEGELRAYQQGINLYVALKSDGGISKSGLFRSFSGFFNYYDLATGDTNLDTVFPGASVILRISGSERIRVNSSGNTQITGSLRVTGGITGSVTTALSASEWTGGPTIKTGIVSGSAFTGNPKVATITFAAPFPNVMYSVTVTGEISRTWMVQSKTINGFQINSNNNGAFTNLVYWSAMSRGEF